MNNSIHVCEIKYQVNATSHINLLEATKQKKTRRLTSAGDDEECLFEMVLDVFTVGH